MLPTNPTALTHLLAYHSLLPFPQRASSVQSLIIHGCVNGTPDGEGEKHGRVIGEMQKIGQTVATALKRGIGNRVRSGY